MMILVVSLALLGVATLLYIGIRTLRTGETGARNERGPW
jgi:threonine/homoserine/homoserine lactone efflux protein